MLTYAGLSVIRTLEIRTHGYTGHFWANYDPIFPLGNPDDDRITGGKLRQIHTETGAWVKRKEPTSFLTPQQLRTRSIEYRGSCSHIYFEVISIKWPIIIIIIFVLDLQLILVLLGLHVKTRPLN